MNGHQDDPGIWSLGTAWAFGVLLGHLVPMVLLFVFLFIAADRYLARDWKSFVGAALAASGAWGIVWLRQRFR